MTRATTGGEPQATGATVPTPAATADLNSELRLQRNLKILVIGMGLLILLGLGAVVARMVGFATGSAKVATAEQTSAGRSGTGQPAAALPTSGGVPQLALDLPKGAKIVSMSVSGDRLAVQHEGPSGTGIAIIDVVTGKRIADVTAREDRQAN